MVNLNGARDSDERASLGQLVGSLADNVSTLVRDEIALAKAEIGESAKRGAVGGALLAATAALLIMVWLLLSFAAVYGLSAGTGLALWASFLIVALVYLLIALIVAFIGSRQLKKARGPALASEAANETKEILTGLKPTLPGAATSDGAPTAPSGAQAGPPDVPTPTTAGGTPTVPNPSRGGGSSA
jgi:hypothetical protein